MLSPKTARLFFVAVLLSLALFGWAVSSAFRPAEVPLNRVAETVREQFTGDVAQLQTQSASLSKGLQELEDGKGSLVKVQEAFYAVKRAYKRVEYLAEYLDPELARNLNGAPLPKVVVDQSNYQTLAFNKPTFRTFPPEGLQVLEEMLFTGEPAQMTPADAKAALVLAYTLQENTGLLAGSLQKQPLTDKQLLESMREELVRVMTKGITGFDAPAAGGEISLTALALEPVLAAARLYEATAPEAAREPARAAVGQLERILSYLQAHPHFDTFDRLHFIRELADPAYASLTALHHELALGTAPLARPVDDRARSLFSRDFLQPAFYAKQDQGTQPPALVELGKLLFFDPVLSANNQRSCASCHAPAKAFADGQARSVAFDRKGVVLRNAPTLLNAVFSESYFWDSRAQYLQDQVPAVLLKADELHGSYEKVVGKLGRSPEYVQLFRRAFSRAEDKSISVNTINRAIAAYVQSLVALDSPFDRYMRGETAQLDPAAGRGFNLFMGKAACGTCHFAPAFNGTVPPRYLESESEVLGVPSTPDLAHPRLDDDLGRAGVIPAEAWRHSFKTPTVRNAALTAPYMHNGVFATLDEVLEFYDQGGGAGIGLAVPNQTLPDGPLELSTSEKADLVAFMHALTDSTYAASAPQRLPRFPEKLGLNGRPVGGAY
jgi:cytochrome c peroxidase